MGQLATADVAFEFSNSDLEPVLHVCVPVHNQAVRIVENLQALMQTVVQPFDLVIVVDSSTDGTLEKVLNFLQTTELPKNSCKVTVLNSSDSLFETKADCIGFRSARAPYLLEVQADMTLLDVGFDLRMTLVMGQFQDIFALSGRGTESFEGILASYSGAGLKSALARAANPWGHLALSFRLVRLARQVLQIVSNKLHRKSANSPNKHQTPNQPIFPDSFQFRANKGHAGRLGNKIDSRLPENLFATHMRTVWLGETVMRGPLIIRRDAYEELGGLDEKRFFLGFDEHDLVARAWIKRNLRVGFVPVDFSAPVVAGSTRERRSFTRDLDIFTHMNRTKTGHENTGLAQLNRGLVSRPRPEIRHF